MRLRHPGGRLVHLSYGTNVHPVQDLPGVIAQLDTYATAIRARLDVDILGLSLWLPPSLAAALAIDARARDRLRTELHARGLEVVTLSGVPYRGGAESAAQPARHWPDWTTGERLEYTLDLARVLVDLLPDDAVRGSVSTCGLGRRAGWGTAQDREAARILGRLSGGLAEVAWHTGRAVRVGFQPEPGCVMDTTDQTIAALAGFDKDRLGVCLDLANLACTWQAPAEALDQLARAGVPVVKVQAAMAIDAADPVVAAAAAPLTATTAVWREALRHLMAGAIPGCDHLDMGTDGWDVLPAGERAGGVAALAEGIAAELAYTLDDLTGLGLVPTARACAGR
jgi:sugar phosphate isomerase/epimerase